jgi:hypothetical protein
MLGDFLDAVDIPKSRVVNHPRYVFLCGGRLPTGTSGTSSPPISLRQTLLETIARDHPDLNSDILLAESVFSTFDEAHYTDLLRFERDLAYFCSAIIIIVESAGAIAELGAFVLLDPVIDKLYAILDDSHYNAPSFIRRGPVEYLKSYNDKSVYSYDWLTASGKRPSI